MAELNQKKISSTREWFKKNYDASDEQLKSLFNQIGQVESGNKDIRQNVLNKQTGELEPLGAGTGYFQFESEKDLRGGKGSGAFQVALNRYENLNKKMLGYAKNKETNQLEPTNGVWEPPEWVAKARESDSAVGLTREQQEDLLLADFAEKKGSDDLIHEALDTGDAKDLWLQKHWAGAAVGTEEYKAKGAQWDANVPAPMKWIDSEEDEIMNNWLNQDNLIQEDTYS